MSAEDGGGGVDDNHVEVASCSGLRGAVIEETTGKETTSDCVVSVGGVSKEEGSTQAATPPTNANLSIMIGAMPSNPIMDPIDCGYTARRF